MDKGDIIMVLSQASELHAKINSAIERVSDNGRRLSVANEEKENIINGDKYLFVDENVSMEAINLASIRDSLDVLEDQLYCLQILQEQQEAEKEAALVDLEKSRRIFLERLRRHRGREWAVVQEAFAFVGEPIEEDKRTQYSNQDSYDSNDAIKRIAWIEETEDDMVVRVEDSERQKKGVVIEEEQAAPWRFLRILCDKVRETVKFPFTSTVKTAIVAAAIMSLVAVSTMGRGKGKGKARLSNGRIQKATAFSPPLPDHRVDLINESCQSVHEEGHLEKSCGTQAF